MDKQYGLYGLFYYYGDTRTEELMDTFEYLEDAQRRAKCYNDHIDCDAWELGDCYFVRKI